MARGDHRLSRARQHRPTLISPFPKGRDVGFDRPARPRLEMDVRAPGGLGRLGLTLRHRVDPGVRGGRSMRWLGRVGALEYSDAIVVGSRGLDVGLLLGASVAVAAVHLLVFRKGVASDPIGSGAFLVLLGGRRGSRFRLPPSPSSPWGWGACSWWRWTSGG